MNVFPPGQWMVSFQVSADVYKHSARRQGDVRRKQAQTFLPENPTALAQRLTSSLEAMADQLHTGALCQYQTISGQSQTSASGLCMELSTQSCRWGLEGPQPLLSCT